MSVSPYHATLVADTELVVTLDANYGQIEVTVIAGPAVTYFNTNDTAIGAVAGDMSGNHVLPAVLCSKTVRDATSGAVSKVRLRSAGTPTVSVCGL